MLSNAFDSQAKVQQLFWFGVVSICAILLGYLLASDMTVLAMGVAGVIWMMLLPYHSMLAVGISIATFSSAIIVPFFPGRPYAWEFSALLGWSGLLVTVSMRKYDLESMSTFRAHRAVFLGLAGYAVVLVIMMWQRGVGMRILGSGQMGGRFYVQQLVCTIFPALFVMWRANEKAVTTLFQLQCLLTTTFLISDFVLTYAPQQLYFLLQFFELPGDAVAFEVRAQQTGLRRFQSLYVASLGLIFFLMVRFKLAQFFKKEGVFLFPLALGLVGMGLLSGHRYVVMILGFTLLFCSYAQRFYTFKHNMLGLGVVVLGLAFTYSFAEYLPLAAQRAASFLPGIQVDPQARDDAMATLDTRKMLRQIGWNMVPDYIWLGRGFGQASSGDYSSQWDPTTITQHINQGKFYNGLIGLLVNTGLPGTVFMLMFLWGGTVTSWQIIKHLREHGVDDYFSRMCSVIASLWLANVIAFVFLHGDSEFALKTFSLQAGLLIVTLRLLRRRTAPAMIETAEPVAHESLPFAWHARR